MSWWSFARRRPMRLSPRQGYRRWAATYGSEPNELQRLEHEAMVALLPPLGGLRTLDVGCGTGRLVRLARDRGARWVAGADETLAMILRAGMPSPSPGPWLQATASQLPFADRTFDVVTCGLVLGHVAELEPALLELGRVLVPGGALLLSDFHPFATLRGMERTFNDPDTGRTVAVIHHLHLFEEYMSALGKAGLVLEALSEPCYLGTPVVFVLRAAKRAS